MPAASRSVIDAWLAIAGNLTTEGEILVEGSIKGDVRCVQVVIGAEAVITGNVTADEVIVHGKVTGSIRANRVVLKDTAVVDCEISYRSLLLERGACFDGSARRCDQPLAKLLDAQIGGLKRAGAALSAVEANGRAAFGGDVLDACAG